MKKLFWTTVAGTAAAACVMRARRRESSCERVLLRHAADLARQSRGRLDGIAYRLSRRQPDPGVDHNVLADRIRSTLGPLEARLDLPHIHVMVEDHVALLHGDVATAADADEIEVAVAAMSGVAGVESYLHVGLLGSDTRPSEGRRYHPPSAAMRQLLEAANAAGVSQTRAPRALCAVLSVFTDELPADESRQLLGHLPDDVCGLAALPHRLGVPAVRARTASDLLGLVATLSGLPDASTLPLVVAVLAELRQLVPEEVEDVTSVLPSDLRALWVPA